MESQPIYTQAPQQVPVNIDSVRKQYKAQQIHELNFTEQDTKSHIFVTFTEDMKDGKVPKKAKKGIDNYLKPYVPGLEFHLVAENEYNPQM